MPRGGAPRSAGLLAGRCRHHEWLGQGKTKVSMRAALSVRAVEFGGLGRKVAVGLLSFCRSHAGWLGFRALLQCSKSCPIQAAAVAGAA